MKIRTSTWIAASRESLWPLLTGSRMDLPGWFCLGLPRPVSCELPEALGGVGAERRCISDHGTVAQRITSWEPPQQLRFSMVTTDHRWESCVESLHEDFLLEERRNGTRITRTTQLTAKGKFRWLKELGFCIGLKRVHLFVFKNWKAAGEAPHLAS